MASGPQDCGTCPRPVAGNGIKHEYRNLVVYARPRQTDRHGRRRQSILHRSPAWPRPPARAPMGRVPRTRGSIVDSGAMASLAALHHRRPFAGCATLRMAKAAPQQSYGHPRCLSPTGPRLCGRSSSGCRWRLRELGARQHCKPDQSSGSAIGLVLDGQRLFLTRVGWVEAVHLA